MIIIIHFHLQNCCRSLSTTDDNGAVVVVVETKSTRMTICLLCYGDGCDHGIIVPMVLEEEEEVPSVLHD